MEFKKSQYYWSVVTVFPLVVGKVSVLSHYILMRSVPTLAVLLRPPAERPVLFHRGYDVVDPVGVGFVAKGPQAIRNGTPLDTRLPGNGNQGHTYGTNMQSGDKRALVEYTKSL